MNRSRTFLTAFLLLGIGSLTEIQAQISKPSDQDSLMIGYVESVLQMELDSSPVVDTLATYTLAHQTSKPYSEIYIPPSQLMLNDSIYYPNDYFERNSLAVDLKLLKRWNIVQENSGVFNSGFYTVQSRSEGQYLIINHSYILQYGSMTSWGTTVTSYYERENGE